MGEYHQDKDTLEAALGHDHAGNLHDHHAQDALAASILGDGAKKQHLDDHPTLETLKPLNP
jgi:hypothetical protein